MRTHAASFVGRREELRELRELLESGASLITVFGAPGIGKSRLVQALLASMSDLQTIWIDLAGATTAEEMFGRFAQALGVASEKGAPPALAISVAVRARGMVTIVIDHADRLVSELRDALPTFLEHAADAQFLVTCVRKLGGESEQAFDLAPLSLPSSAAGESEPSDSVALWELCVRRVQPTYRAESERAETLRDLMQKLDGLPLAIELAAGRRRVLSTDAILLRMDRRFELLRGGSSSLNHGSLETALREAVDALSPTEKDAFAGLAVLPGQFDLDDARIAIGASVSIDAETLIESLRDHSVLAATAGDPPRFFLFESLRDIALALTTPEQRDAVIARVSPHYVAWGEANAEAAARRNDEGAIGWLLHHEETLLILANAAILAGAAIDQAEGGGAEIERSLRLLTPLATVVARLKAPRRYDELLARALRAAEEHARVAAPKGDELHASALATAYAARSLLAFGAGDFDLSRKLAENALAIADPKSHARAQAHATLGRLEYILVHPGPARAHFEEAEIAAERLASRPVYRAWQSLMDILIRGDAAREELDENVSAALLAVGTHARGDLLLIRVGALAALGQMKDAELDAVAALDAFQATGQLRPQGQCLWMMAGAALFRGEYELAVERAKASLDIFEQTVTDRARDVRLWVTAYLYAKTLVFASKPDEAAAVLARYPMTEPYQLSSWHDALAVLVCAASGDFERARKLADAIDFERIGNSMSQHATELVLVWPLVWESEKTPGDHALRQRAEARVHEVLARPYTDANINLAIHRQLLAKAIGAMAAESETLQPWIFDPQGLSFQPPNAAPIDLHSSPVLSKTIELLLSLRREAPGQYIPSQSLIAALWPNDRALKHHLVNRLSVHLTRLRRLGFAAILEKHGTGYRLSPTAPIDVRQA